IGAHEVARPRTRPADQSIRAHAAARDHDREDPERQGAEQAEQRHGLDWQATLCGGGYGALRTRAGPLDRRCIEHAPRWTRWFHERLGRQAAGGRFGMSSAGGSSSGSTGVDGRLGGPEGQTSGPSGHFAEPDVGGTLATSAYLPLIGGGGSEPLPVDPFQAVPPAVP